MTNRLSYIDLAKAVGIFLMVLCHGVVPAGFDHWVHAFHMPLFFLVSGWCFSANRHPNFGKFIQSRAKSLLLPYLFWSVVIFFGWQLFYQITNPAKCYPLTGFLYHAGYNNAAYSPFCAVQWFLTCMFFTQVLALITLKLTKEKPLPTLLAAMGLGALGWGCSYLPLRLPLSLDVAFMACLFFLFGWALAKVKNQKNLFHPLCVLVYWGAGTALALINGSVNMRIMSYQNPLVFALGGILLSMGVLGGCVLLANRYAPPFMVWIGKNTLPILMLNQVFIGALKLAFSTRNSWIWLAFSVGITVCMAPCILFLNNFLPFSVGKTKKV